MLVNSGLIASQLHPFQNASDSDAPLDNIADDQENSQMVGNLYI